MVVVNGSRVDQLSERELMKVRNDLGMIFQEGALFDSLTVRENVGYKLYEETSQPLEERRLPTGALAQRLGIKPGSPEFHALKKGFVPTYDRWARPIDIDDEHRHAPASTCFYIEISSSLASPSRTDGAAYKAPPAPAARPLYKRKSVFLI